MQIPVTTEFSTLTICDSISHLFPQSKTSLHTDGRGGTDVFFAPQCGYETPLFMPTVKSLVRLYHHLVILFEVKCDQMVTVNHFLNVLALDRVSFISNIISVKILSNFNFHTDDSKFLDLLSLSIS